MAASERVFKLAGYSGGDYFACCYPRLPTGPGRIEFDHVWFAYRNVDGKDAGESPRPHKLAGNGRVGTGLRPVQAEQSFGYCFDRA